MTDGDRIAIAFALSVSIHWGVFATLTRNVEPDYEISSDAFFVDLPLTGAPVGISMEAPLVLEAEAVVPSEPEERQQDADDKARERRRIAMDLFLDSLSQEVHSKRLVSGYGQRFVGNALVSLQIDSDSKFSSVTLRRSSGDKTLDADAMQAVQSASGLVARPPILGSVPLHITIAVKYQFGL